jgi:hypothetical protein
VGLHPFTSRPLLHPVSHLNLPSRISHLNTILKTRRLLVGYIIACIFFIPVYIKDRKAMKLAGGEHGIKPERRMIGLLWLVLLEPIGLFAFAWTSLGPPEVHWIAPLIFVAMIGIANLAIYQATCDYMVRPCSPFT